MGLVQKICALLSSQINTSSAKLPKKVVEQPKIKDNDQSIKLGAINEEYTHNLRSTGKTGTGRRRVKKS
jgi:hypothetical protein